MEEKRKTKTAEEKKALSDDNNKLDIVELQNSNLKALHDLSLIHI